MWAAILTAAAAAFLVRVSLLAPAVSAAMPPGVHARLRSLGPAALGALTASLLSGGGARAPGAAAVAGVVVGFVVARRTQNLAAALVAGLAVAAAVGTVL